MSILDSIHQRSPVTQINVNLRLCQTTRVQGGTVRVGRGCYATNTSSPITTVTIYRLTGLPLLIYQVFEKTICLQESLCSRFLAGFDHTIYNIFTDLQNPCQQALNFGCLAGFFEIPTHPKSMTRNQHRTRIEPPKRPRKDDQHRPFYAYPRTRRFRRFRPSSCWVCRAGHLRVLEGDDLILEDVVLICAKAPPHARRSRRIAKKTGRWG